MYEQLITVARQAGGLGDPSILYERNDVLVVRVGHLVVKSHHAGTGDLPVRVAVADAHPGIFLSPLAPVRTVGGRLVSVWPAGDPVDPMDPERVPWEEGGRLLAALHKIKPAGPLPRQGAPGKVHEVMTRLPEHPASPVIRRAYASLPKILETDGQRTVVHGDFHLGQMVLDGGLWKLIDLDDLGLGDPAWDIARPAAFYAAGILPPDAWARFLGAYQAAGGSAVPPGTDPWERLDLPAKAIGIQTAARCVSHAVDEGRPLDAYETALIDTCDRIGSLTQA